MLKPILLPSFVAFSAFPKCLARDETQSGELGENKEVERNSENPHVFAGGEKIYSKHTLRLWRPTAAYSRLASGSWALPTVQWANIFAKHLVFFFICLLF